jgi:hypothetical protein
MNVVIEPVSIGKQSVDQFPIDAQLAVGDVVIYQRRCRATVVEMRPDEVVVGIEDAPVPDCSDTIRRDRGIFVPMSNCFSAVRAKSGFYRIVRPILGSVRSAPTADSGCFNLRSAPGSGALGCCGNVDILLASRLATAVTEWCRRAPSIPPLLTQSNNKTIGLSGNSVFPRQPNAAASIRAWLDGEFGNSGVPLVEETLSQEAMAEVAQRCRQGATRVTRLAVKESELLRQNHAETAQCEIDWCKPVISISPDKSFECVGCVVGRSEIARTAAVLFTQAKEGFANFGCPGIDEKVRKTVEFDDLLQL